MSKGSSESKMFSSPSSRNDKMETRRENRATPIGRYRIMISTSHIVILFLWTFPIESFLPKERRVIKSVSLFSHEEKQNGQYLQNGKGERNRQTPTRRYAGGMIRPTVTPKKSMELSPDFVKANGQDEILDRMIRPTATVKKSMELSPDLVKANRQDTGLDGMIQPTTTAKKSTEMLPDFVKSNGQDASLDGMIRPTTTAKKSMELSPDFVKVNEQDTSFDRMIRPISTAKKSIELPPSFVKVNGQDTSLDRTDSTKISIDSDKQPLYTSRSQATMFRPSVDANDDNSAINPMSMILDAAEAEACVASGENSEAWAAEENGNELDAHQDSKSDCEEETNSLRPIAEIKTKEIERISNQSTAGAEPTETAEPTLAQLSAMEAVEEEKLRTIQAKIENRKQQQIELDRIEEELLRRTNEIKAKKNDLLKLEKELARTKTMTGENIESSDNIPGEKIIKPLPYYSPKEYSALSPEEKKQLKEDRAALRFVQQFRVDNSVASDIYTHVGSKATAHPILGPVMADLGYKRVHIVSSGRLGTIPIWKKQQTFRIDRARRMAADKKDQMHLGFPGIICLHEDNEGKLSILDGQHRVAMMQVLRENRNKLKKTKNRIESKNENDRVWEEEENYFQNVLVEVYSELSKGNSTNTSNKNQSYSDQVFLEINKAEPIKLPS